MSGDEEMSEAESAWHDWSMLQDGVATPNCDCGHDGMGIAWHSFDCRGQYNALAAKARQLHELAWNAGLLTAKPCEHQFDWFDRTVCPDPCGSMHQRCTGCGKAQGHCCWEGRS